MEAVVVMEAGTRTSVAMVIIAGSPPVSSTDYSEDIIFFDRMFLSTSTRFDFRTTSGVVSGTISRVVTVAIRATTGATGA